MLKNFLLYKYNKKINY